MRGLSDFVLTYQLGPVIILPLIVLMWAIATLLAFLIFPVYMKVIGLPATFSWRQVKMLPYYMYISWGIGQEWFVKRNYNTFSFISASTLTVCCARAIENKNAVEFARGGAIVVAISGVLLLVDLYEGELYKRRAGLDGFQKFFAENAERAHRWAMWYIAVISAVGTIVWAYGDQALACGIPPVWNGISDKGSVACFVRKQEEAAKTGSDDALARVGDLDNEIARVSQAAELALSTARRSAELLQDETRTAERSAEGQHAALAAAQQSAQVSQAASAAAERFAQSAKNALSVVEKLAQVIQSSLEEVELTRQFSRLAMNEARKSADEAKLAVVHRHQRHRRKAHKSMRKLQFKTHYSADVGRQRRKIQGPSALSLPSVPTPGLGEPVWFTPSLIISGLEFT